MEEIGNFLIGEILYNLRKKYYNTAVHKINESLNKFGNNSVLKYYNAIALILQEKNHDAIKELEFLKNCDDVGVGVLLALIHAHKKFPMIDHETIISLEAKVTEALNQADERTLYYAGYFFYITERPDKAREYIDRAIKMSDSCIEALCVKGWIEIENNPKNANLFFEKVVSLNPKHVDALFGIAKAKECQNMFTKALDYINMILVSNPNYLSAIVEKIRLQLTNNDWDLGLDIVQHALSIDSSCVEAISYQVLELLCRKGRYNDAGLMLENLYRLLESQEPNSPYLYYDCSKVFARVCGKNSQVLKHTEQFLEKAVTLHQTNTVFLVELGFQKAAQDKIKDADKCYTLALKFEKNNITALLGKLHCQIAECKLEDASQQVEFLTEAQESLNKNAEFPYLKAILERKKNSDNSKRINIVEEAIMLHFRGLKGLPLGKDYIYNLNPDFILGLVTEYLTCAPSKPIKVGERPDPLFKKCTQILEPLTKAVPGFIPGLFYLGKIKYFLGETNAAINLLQNILDKDPSHTDARILMAKISNIYKISNYYNFKATKSS